MQEHLGFQLFLVKKDRDFLFPIISELQDVHVNNPPFEPHLSIHTAIWVEREDAIRVVEQVASGMKKFVVSKEGFGYQDKWSKILYIKIEENKILNQLHEAIGNGLNSLDKRPFIPHISLMYKDELADDVRKDITAKLKVPDLYEVGGIEIVHPGTEDVGWRDYTMWKVVYRISFK